MCLVCVLFTHITHNTQQLHLSVNTLRARYVLDQETQDFPLAQRSTCTGIGLKGKQKRIKSESRVCSCRLCSTAFIGYWQDSSLCISDCISDRLHCSIHFDFCFFLPKNKNLIEYAQAHPRGLYTQPKADKIVERTNVKTARGACALHCQRESIHRKHTA